MFVLSVMRDDHTLQQIGDNVNTFLKVTAGETPFVHIVDNDNLSRMGSIKGALYSPDGYHINRFGVRVLAANFKRTVHPLLGLGQYMGKAGRDVGHSSHTSQRTRSPTPNQYTTRRQGQQEHTARNDLPPTRYGQDGERNQDPPRCEGTPMERPATAPKPPHPGRPPFLPSHPGRPPFLPSQAPGPWGYPPAMFSHPPVPWGMSATNSPPNSSSRINSPPSRPWHPAMLWPPMINMW
ncbi:Hypp3679 [Branchiostoma lanceolatum]|uniref:Hypp3679 protein n=1 Tax=Branchiostoma lanceolatum TaxID=7740 RepID=A0A8K0EYB8_BRALA|nr:Hypp3679 [Branchiostoma lanceolatum]